MVAAGTKNGLILLIDSEKMEIIARLRGQDTEITSLDFMVFPVLSKGYPRPQTSKTQQAVQQVI